MDDKKVVCPYCGAKLGDCDAWEWTSEEEEECRKCEYCRKYYPVEFMAFSDDNEREEYVCYACLKEK